MQGLTASKIGLEETWKLGVATVRSELCILFGTSAGVASQSQVRNRSVYVGKGLFYINYFITN